LLTQIKIKAISKRNGLTILLGCLVVLALVLLLRGVDVLTKIPSYFAISLCLAGLFVGIVKLREPEFSLLIDKSGIKYKHVRGSLYFRWQDIQRIDVPTINRGLETKRLPYVAFRLRSQTQLLDSISPRLASHLVTEQKELVIAALQDDFANWQCADGTCPSEELYKFEDYKTDSKVYKGLLAMFGHRLALLRDKLGYEVFIPASALDREPELFVQLLKRLQADIG